MQHIILTLFLFRLECPASIGFDLQITERNIHELYKLTSINVPIVQKSATQPFEQAQFNLVFGVYSERTRGNQVLLNKGHFYTLT